MTNEPERRVYYADCYWLRAYGYVSWSGKFKDGTKCTLEDAGTRTPKHPDLVIVGCPEGCSDYRDEEGRRYHDG